MPTAKLSNFDVTVRYYFRGSGYTDRISVAGWIDQSHIYHRDRPVGCVLTSPDLISYFADTGILASRCQQQLRNAIIGSTSHLDGELIIDGNSPRSILLSIFLRAQQHCLTLLNPCKTSKDRPKEQLEHWTYQFCPFAHVGIINTAAALGPVLKSNILAGLR